jgi:hypothetical protein
VHAGRSLAGAPVVGTILRVRVVVHVRFPVFGLVVFVVEER